MHLDTVGLCVLHALCIQRRNMHSYRWVSQQRERYCSWWKLCVDGCQVSSSWVCWCAWYSHSGGGTGYVCSCGVGPRGLGCRGSTCRNHFIPWWLELVWKNGGRGGISFASVLSQVMILKLSAIIVLMERPWVLYLLVVTYLYLKW